MIDNQRISQQTVHRASTKEPTDSPTRTSKARRLLLSLVLVVGIATAGCTPEELEANLGTGGLLAESFEDAFTTGSGLEGAFFRAADAAERIVFAVGMRLGPFLP